MNSPCKRPEDSCRFSSMTHASEAASVTDEDCGRDESGEPEYHCDSINCHGCKIVHFSTGEAQLRYDQVDERKQCPYCTEYEEAE